MAMVLQMQYAASRKIESSAVRVRVDCMLMASEIN